MSAPTVQQQEPGVRRTDYDAVIIGAGFAGMYQLHKLRELGFSAHVYEAGTGVGGTWYWNRYPGARVDIESAEYSLSFDEDLQQEWTWKERYAPQPELLEYAEHVADRFDLKKDITFNTRIKALTYDSGAGVWTVTPESGDPVTAQFVIAATGCLSVPSRPNFEGQDSFEGDIYYTSGWPREGVDLSGKRVAVIGTGSSGLQTITAIAPEVGSLTVFQRTPSFAVPAHNQEISEEDTSKIKANYDEIRATSRASKVYFDTRASFSLLAEQDQEAIQREFDERWARGGLGFTAAYYDILMDPESNDVAAEYVRAKIREKVKDPEVAELLSPRTYPIASKRMCVDTGYYETYNRDNVTLVDLRSNPIKRITPTGIDAGEKSFDFDVIVFATGFDAMTGALNAIDIQADGRSLREKWEHGPRTYLGLMSEGFPNLFMMTGPGSPSVLSNMMMSIEYHVQWIAKTLDDLRAAGKNTIEPALEAEDNWVATVNDLAAITVMPQANSWYMGANIPGKERIFMPFIGGCEVYAAYADGVQVANYHGFELQ